MQARRAARELALILFSQFDKDLEKYTATDFDNIILKSVRALTNNAYEELQISVSPLFKIKEFIENYETDHEINLQRPLEANNLPVPIPMTSDMTGRIDEILNVAEKSLLALEIAEMTTLEEKSEVKKYLMEVAKQYQKHHEEIDGYISEYAFGWDIERLYKIDKDILRIAITELLFIKETPIKVIIDEALELAKKYSTDDSTSFINGILAKVVKCSNSQI